MAAARLESVLHRYLVYVMVAAFVGALTIGMREILQWFMPADTPVTYGFTVLAAYSLGTILNYSMQRRVTFAQSGKLHDNPSQFLKFIMVSVSGAVLTMVFSHLLRYGLSLDEILGRLAGGVCFGVAALTTSVFSYSLSALYIFPAQRDDGTPR